MEERNYFLNFFLSGDDDKIIKSDMKMDMILKIKEAVKKMNGEDKDKVYKLFNFFNNFNSLDEILEIINDLKKYNIDNYDVEDIYCIMLAFNEDIKNSIEFIKEYKINGIGKEVKDRSFDRSFYELKRKIIEKIFGINSYEKVVFFLNFGYSLKKIKDKFINILKKLNNKEIEILLINVKRLYKYLRFKIEFKEEDILELWEKNFLGKNNCLEEKNLYRYSFLVNFIDKVNFISNFCKIYIDEDSIDDEGNIKYKISDFIKNIVIEDNKKIKKINNLPENLELLIIKGTDLETLENCSKKVRRFECKNNNKLKNLVGSPEEVEEIFCEGNNNLKNLEGCPKKIDRLYCYFNKNLEFLEGCQKYIRKVNCMGNDKLKNLKGDLEEVDRFYCINNNSLETLENNFKKIKYFVCKDCSNLKDLTGLPNNEGTEIEMTTNRYLSREDIEKYIKDNNIKSKVIIK